MIKTLNFKDLTWHDLENPSEKEIAEIMNLYPIPKDAAEDLLSPTPKQRMVEYKNCIYIVMHFPELRDPRSKNHRKEIDFILGKKFIITAHYDSVNSINSFIKSFASDRLFESEETEYNAGHIFHKLIKDLYHNLLHDVEIVKEALAKSTSSIFKGKERQMVVELSNIHRDILRFKAAILPHRESITSLFSSIRKMFGEEYEYFIQDMSSEFQRVERRMQSNKDLLDELRLTNDSLLSAKQNEAMKGLTMMAFIIFPLNLIATIFGMNTKNLPIIGSDFDFWIILGMMVVVTIVILTFFKHKKWL